MGQKAESTDASDSKAPAPTNGRGRPAHNPPPISMPKPPPWEKSA